MNERELSLFAYQTRREIQRILASTPPREAPDRAEDVILGAFLVVKNDTRQRYQNDQYICAWCGQTTCHDPQ